MADELDELILSTAAQLLIFDLGTHCTATRSRGGAPCVVMQRPGWPIPKTKGQVSDSAVDELATHGLIEFVGETFPQPFRLTLMGEAYFDRFLKHLSNRSVVRKKPA
jgi:hypothetical protein